MNIEIMEKIFEKFFDLQKIPTQLISVIWFTSLVILFVPKSYLAILNLEPFLIDYGKYIGVIFVVATGFLIVALLTYIFTHVKNYKEKNQIKMKVKRNLKKLTFAETIVLREFFINQKSTIQLPFLDETVISLENKMIIYKASNTGTVTRHGQLWPYSISDYALSNLNHNNLSMPESPTEEEKEKILRERPNWTL